MALTLGSLAGPAWETRASPWLGWGWVGLAPVLLVAAAVWVRHGSRRLRGAPLWIGLVFVAAAARSACLERSDGRPTAMPDAKAPPLEKAREGIRVGRWIPWGGSRTRRGWLAFEGGGAGGSRSRPADAQPAVPGLLFETVGPAPPEGAWVAVLPGSEVVRQARGPVRRRGPPSARFEAITPVRPDELVHLGGFVGGRSLAERVATWRADLSLRVRALEAPEAPGLLRALVLGDRGGLAPATSDLFTRTGTRHLLAVSGLHVGLVAATLLFPLAHVASGILTRHPARRRRIRTTLVVAALVPFALLTGAAPPVVRATLAIGLGACAFLFSSRRVERSPDGLSLWSFALALECLADPRSVHSLSVQLSYLATLGLLVSARPIRGRPATSLATRGGNLVAVTRIACARVLRILFTGVRASLAAVLATLPIAFGAFGECSPVGVVATPLVVVFVLWILAAAAPALAVPSLATVLGVEPAQTMFVRALELADALPGTPVPTPLRPAPLLWATSLTTVLWWGRSRPWPRPARAALGRILAAAWAAILLPWSAAPAGLEVHTLDAGHGACTVLRGPGLPALVFDAGSRDRPDLYAAALAPLLARWEVARPWIALSHGHRDHHAALGRLASRYPPRAWLGALPSPLSERLPHGTHVFDVEQGRLAVPLPRSPWRLTLVRGLPTTGNEGSRALELWNGSERLLLCGDAEGEGLEAALREGWIRGPSRLLLLPHHGSDTDLLGPLLARTRPEEVWVPCGREPPVARELTRRGLRWHWTGRDGSLALFLRRERRTQGGGGNP